MVRECPRSYYMAFIVKRGYPLLPIFSDRVRYLFEAGKLN